MTFDEWYCKTSSSHRSAKEDMRICWNAAEEGGIYYELYLECEKNLLQEEENNSELVEALREAADEMDSYFGSSRLEKMVNKYREIANRNGVK